MTIEMIPNYRHYNFHEKQFMDFMMWVSHVFDGRPISRIVDITHEFRDGRNYHRAKVQFVRTWFVYANNPQWRDLMWFEWIMQKRGDYYETSVPGAKPDAYMIEVADTAMGFPGYVALVNRAVRLIRQVVNPFGIEIVPHGGPICQQEVKAGLAEPLLLP